MGKTKKCSKCGKIKDLNLFTLHPQCRNGRSNVCKSCEAERKRNWFLLHYIPKPRIYKLLRVVLVCPKCKKKFKVHPNQAKRRKFCSLQCFYTFNKKGRNKKLNKIREKMYRAALTNSYLIGLIQSQFHLKSKEITREMISLKREQIKATRLMAEYRKEIAP